MKAVIFVREPAQNGFTHSAIKAHCFVNACLAHYIPSWLYGGVGHADGVGCTLLLISCMVQTPESMSHQYYGRYGVSVDGSFVQIPAASWMHGSIMDTIFLTADQILLL